MIYRWTVIIETSDERPDSVDKLSAELDRALRYRFSDVVAIPDHDIPEDDTVITQQLQHLVTILEATHPATSKLLQEAAITINTRTL
jgi:hypothetical protein